MNVFRGILELAVHPSVYLSFRVQNVGHFVVANSSNSFAAIVLQFYIYIYIDHVLKTCRMQFSASSPNCLRVIP